MARQSIRAREAAQIAPKCIAEITGREPAQMTAVEPTDDDGWIVEVEIVEDRRIPSAADMLALYEIELGPETGTCSGIREPVVTGAQKAWHPVPIRRISE